MDMTVGMNDDDICILTKESFDFGNLDLIFKVTRVIYSNKKNLSALLSYNLLNQWPAFDQIGTDTSLG